MEDEITTLVLISVGAFGGASLRFLISTWAARRFGTAFPYGTAIVNLLGCALIGLFFGVVSARFSLASEARLLLATGLLGAETTFATFAYETVSLIDRRRYRRALVNVGVNTALGLTATAIGLVVAEQIAGGWA